MMLSAAPRLIQINRRDACPRIVIFTQIDRIPMMERRKKTMLSRRRFFFAAGAVLLLGPHSRAHPQQLPLVTVYKDPACGCCGEWVKHLRANGFRVETRELADVAPLRRRYGVPDRLASCHTAVVGEYAIEGHVPAADIQRLLRERSKVRGLAVPGMEQGSPQPYATLAFDDRGSRIFMRH